MKPAIFLVFLAGVFPCFLKAQKVNSEVKLKDLAVPNAPSFMILDISPSLIENPTTPKEFAFGALQTMGQGEGWPQNYAMEFTPYWWIKPEKRDVYQFLGLKKSKEPVVAGVENVSRYNPFSGMKFTNISMAFVNKDLIPDTSSLSQKIFSIGLHSNILKYNRPLYANELDKEINNWHQAVQAELTVLQEELNQENDPVKRRKLQQQQNNKVLPVSSDITRKINAIINQKPLFSWDIAAAYSVYGINNDRFRTGRTGIWTTIASYFPFGKKTDEGNQNYLDLLLCSRYIHDNFSLSQSRLVTSNSLDAGGKIALEFARINIGAELLQRFYADENRSSKTRAVGTISYRLDNNLYISGTFGKDFGPVNKIITLFGLNWGFGDEKIDLPDEAIQNNN